MGSRVVTVTLNPAIDMSSDAEEVEPTRKTRIYGEQIEAGGGGINVSKALAEFNVPVHAIYLAGGPTGGALNQLLSRLPIERDCVPISGDTRMSLAVFERKSGIEYRFVPDGPLIHESEWKEGLKRAVEASCDYLVASGSLPRGVPDDFYARLQKGLKPSIRFVLDTSGAGLKAAVENGGIFLLKPSDRELREWAGKDLDEKGLARAAADIVERGKAEFVAVTMGNKGAILASKAGILIAPAVPVETRSALGSGDSMVAAMTHAFARGDSIEDAFRLGVAAGAAAASRKGAKLCSATDVKRLLKQVTVSPFDVQV